MKFLKNDNNLTVMKEKWQSLLINIEEKKKIMDLVNANKDTIYADCREQAAYEEDEDYEE